MYITVDNTKNEISLEYPIDNRNGNKKVGLIHTYFIYSFYNVEKDEKIHLKNGSPLLVKRGCYTTKDIEKVSSGKVKYDSLTDKSIIDSTISQFGPYMNKILGISNGNYSGHTTIKKNVLIASYYTDKYALWLDFRTIDNNRLHGSGRRLENTSEGIRLQITKKAESAGNCLAICIYFRTLKLTLVMLSF